MIPNFSIIVPTYNAGPNWGDWIAAYQSQLLKADKVIVIDSSSSDNTAEHADESGFLVHSIPKSEFNHGGTRNQAVEFAKSFADVVVFMTQDAILASPDSLANLLAPFVDPEVARCV